jgi:hypothetical protein
MHFGVILFLILLFAAFQYQAEGEAIKSYHKKKKNGKKNYKGRKY